jgi:hypothetical protein
MKYVPYIYQFAKQTWIVFCINEYIKIRQIYSKVNKIKYDVAFIVRVTKLQNITVVICSQNTQPKHI